MPFNNNNITPQGSNAGQSTPRGFNRRGVGRGGVFQRPQMPSSWYGEQPSTSQQPSAKRARQETHEVMAEPAEPKPKPGTKEFALHKLNFHKQRMADAHEAKLAAEIRYAAEAEKAANWQLKVDEWEDKGSTSKTIEDDLAKLVNEKKAAMKK